jgi:hypothetical protein
VAPGSIGGELRRDLRSRGLRSTAKLWGIPQSHVMRIAAGLDTRRASVVTALKHLLARFEDA